jgi:hypothetical protein
MTSSCVDACLKACSSQESSCYMLSGLPAAGKVSLPPHVQYAVLLACRCSLIASLPLPSHSQVVPEADRKLYTYKGVCIARSNKGPRSWFKVYNVFPDVGGFVQHFPL